MISGATPAIESLRFLRAMVGVLVLLTLWAVSRLWKPAPPKSLCQGCGCQSGQGYASLDFSPQSLNGLDVDRVR
jgi:hypothetical protein